MSVYHQYVGVIQHGPNHDRLTSEFIEAHTNSVHFQTGGQNSSIGLQLDCDGENFASSQDRENGWFFTIVSDDDRGMIELESIAFREGFHKDTCKLQVVRVRWRD